jgi:N utilization substance protein A
MDEINYITLMEQLTKAHIKDCIVGDDELIFIVKEGDMGLAIGRNGEHIAKVREKLGKKVSAIEFSEDPKQFVRNLFAPAQIEDVRVEEENAYLKVRDSKRVLGRNGSRMERAKNLLGRHFSIKEIIIE